MSEERFIDREADDFERMLLASATRDAMRPEQKRAMVLALGLATVATVSTGATVPGAVAGAGKAGTAIVAKSKGTLGVVALGKWILGITLTSAAVVGAGHGVRIAYRASQAPSAEAAQRSPLPTSGPLTAPAAPAAPPPDLLPSVDVAALPSAPALVLEAAALPVAPRVVSAPASPPAQAAPPPAPTTQAPVVPRSAMTDELRAIDRARSAVASGDLQEATRALDAHASAFPAGVFSDEAQVLRIDVLAKKGERRGAEAAARAFLASRPRSPQAPRVRKLLGESP